MLQGREMERTMNKMWRLCVHSTEEKMRWNVHIEISFAIGSRSRDRFGERKRKYMISFLFILKLPWNEMCNVRHIFNLLLCIEIQCHRIGSDFTWYIVLIEPYFPCCGPFAFHINFNATFHSTAFWRIVWVSLTENGEKLAMAKRRYGKCWGEKLNMIPSNSCRVSLKCFSHEWRVIIKIFKGKLQDLGKHELISRKKVIEFPWNFSDFTENNSVQSFEIYPEKFVNFPGNFSQTQSSYFDSHSQTSN